MITLKLQKPSNTSNSVSKLDIKLICKSQLISTQLVTITQPTLCWILQGWEGGRKIQKVIWVLPLRTWLRAIIRETTEGVWHDKQRRHQNWQMSKSVVIPSKEMATLWQSGTSKKTQWRALESWTWFGKENEAGPSGWEEPQCERSGGQTCQSWWCRVTGLAEKQSVCWRTVRWLGLIKKSGRTAWTSDNRWVVHNSGCTTRSTWSF